jgi:hypothetical protein
VVGLQRSMMALGAMAMLVSALYGEAPAQIANQGDQANPEAINSLTLPADDATAMAWTADRLRQSKPMPLPVVQPDEIDRALRDRRLDLREGPRGTNTSVGPLAAVSPAVPNVRAMPLSLAGKLHFTTAEGDMWCSAQFVARRLLLTAAHCIQDNKTGRWYTNFLFDAQYERGRYTKRFGARCMAAKQGWVSPGPEHWVFDYGFILVDADSADGFFGTQWNWKGLHNRATKIGYPNGVEGGELMQVLNGALTFENGVIAMRHGNLLDGHGSSGGAWVALYTPVFNPSANYAVSITSFTIANRPGTSFGPYFTNEFKSLFDFAARGCR